MTRTPPHTSRPEAAARRGLGGHLEDVPTDNDGHQRPTPVYPILGRDQRKGPNQHRMLVRSLDGMQAVTPVERRALHRAATVLWTTARSRHRRRVGSGLVERPGGRMRDELSPRVGHMLADRDNVWPEGP
jgi:hypothetical protein